jgi:hypothetical protein
VGSGSQFKWHIVDDTHAHWPAWFCSVSHPDNKLHRATSSEHKPWLHNCCFVPVCHTLGSQKEVSESSLSCLACLALPVMGNNSAAWRPASPAAACDQKPRCQPKPQNTACVGNSYRSTCAQSTCQHTCSTPHDLLLAVSPATLNLQPACAGRHLEDSCWPAASSDMQPHPSNALTPAPRRCGTHTSKTSFTQHHQFHQHGQSESHQALSSPQQPPPALLLHRSHKQLLR